MQSEQNRPKADATMSPRLDSMPFVRATPYLSSVLG